MNRESMTSEEWQWELQAKDIVREHSVIGIGSAGLAPVSPDEDTVSAMTLLLCDRTGGYGLMRSGEKITGS